MPAGVLLLIMAISHERIEMMQMQNVDVVIVGGGMVGLGLAAALKNSALTIAIVEASVFRLPRLRLMMVPEPWPSVKPSA